MNTQHEPSPERYDHMAYRRCGASGLRLPALSLGLWHNFGGGDDFETMRRMVLTAFDCGVTHFDLANNYGPPPGSAETNFGRILATDLRAHRDELVVSTKAGYRMWPGPYGDLGSRKYLLASLNQSLRRLGLDYVDVFYHHRPDPDTPLEESMGAVADAVRYGKALYAAVSNYDAAGVRRAAGLLRAAGTPMLLHQVRYNLLDRRAETGVWLSAAAESGAGTIVFSPLAQGVLTDRYLNGVPADSRAARNGFLRAESLTPELIARVARLNAFAQGRGQTLAAMALFWILRRPEVTSVIVGASRPEQLIESLKALDAPAFTGDELARLDALLA
ncbi:MAG: aldo/keto reductase [Kiritimatiellae bacterium]|nr:aldo/keto reductase [Kiritimatiellia bacterium]